MEPHPGDSWLLLLELGFFPEELRPWQSPQVREIGEEAGEAKEHPWERLCLFLSFASSHAGFHISYWASI